MNDPINNPLPYASPEMVRFRLMMGDDPNCILTYVCPKLLAKKAAEMLAEQVKALHE